MESYELDADKVLDWVTNYADNDDLERVAKGSYAVYVQRRKKEQPEKQKENRRRYRQMHKLGEYRAKKTWTKAQRKAQRQMQQNAQKFL